VGRRQLDVFVLGRGANGHTATKRVCQRETGQAQAVSEANNNRLILKEVGCCSLDLMGRWETEQQLHSRYLFFC